MTQYALYDRNAIALRPLWPEQVPGIEGVYQAVREGHKRIVLYAPTGYGKSQVAAHLISKAISKGRRPLFTVPALSLVDQTLRKFENEGIGDIGVIQSDHERTNPDAQVQIASIQTLVRRPMPEIDFLIVDEVHMQNRAFNAMLDSETWKNTIAVGLSATPWTKGLGLRWKKMVVGARIQQLIEAGRLSDFRIYAPKHGLDRGSVKTERGEFVEESASKAMSKATIVGDVVKEWFERGPGEKTFLFCVNRAHAKAQMGAFIDSGFPFGYIDGTTPPEERAREFKRLVYGEIAGIASVGCLVAGVDEDVRCICDCAPTLSEMRHQQKWGRGLRTAPLKFCLVGMDHANNNGESGLGLFSEIFHDHLDESSPKQKSSYERETKPPKPRVCKHCGALVSASSPVCPACGGRMGHQVREEKGELALIESRAPKEPKATKGDKQQWYSSFLGIAQERGYLKGWAAHQYRAKFGVWPKSLDRVPTPPTRDALEWDYERRKADRQGVKA